MVSPMMIIFGFLNQNIRNFRRLFKPKKGVKRNDINLPKQKGKLDVVWTGLTWLQRLPEQQCPSIVMSKRSVLLKTCGADSCSV